MKRELFTFCPLRWDQCFYVLSWREEHGWKLCEMLSHQINNTLVKVSSLCEAPSINPREVSLLACTGTQRDGKCVRYDLDQGIFESEDIELRRTLRIDCNAKCSQAVCQDLYNWKLKTLTGKSRKIIYFSASYNCSRETSNQNARTDVWTATTDIFRVFWSPDEALTWNVFWMCAQGVHEVTHSIQFPPEAA